MQHFITIIYRQTYLIQGHNDWFGASVVATKDGKIFACAPRRDKTWTVERIELWDRNGNVVGERTTNDELCDNFLCDTGTQKNKNYYK